MRVNELFEKLSSDIVIVLDADIYLTHDKVIYELVHTFIDNPSLSLVSGVVTPSPSSRFEQTISTGYDLMQEAIRMTSRPGVYTCTGAIRGFKKPLYKQIQFPSIQAEDVYPYLYCKTRGLNYAVAPKAVVSYSLPRTYASFTRQMVRYLSSPRDHGSVFGASIIRKEFSITPWIKTKALVKVFVKKPFYTLAYLVLLLRPKLIHLTRTNPSHGYWQTAR